ncbi:LCP family protein [Mycolicibacterium litorale]|nr:LCP family protein [Mycolicibacterium litorale]MCV7418267.1 LCP family protein [Mycolicibacterium litorale]TDY06341.1 LytR family transcriptional attenuator [Mycolicibacterium litorale]
MSDGDSPGADATPDPRRPREPRSDWDNQWLTRSSQRSPGAAPWERSEPLKRRAAEPEPVAPEETDEESTGSHTGGVVTVADLIAKLNGDGTGPAEVTPKRRRAEPDPEPDPEPEPEAEAEPPAPATEILAPIVEPILEPIHAPGDPDRQDTEIIPAATSAYAEELPLLADEPGDRVPPYRIGDDTAVIADDEPHRRRRVILAGRAAAALLAVLALVLTGGAWQWQSSKNNSMNRVSALDQDSRDILDPNAQFGDENFLIVGVDSRIGENSGMGAGTTDDAAGARSDTVMLVNIPANRKRVVAVSFPRDLSIDPMECEPWNPETGAYGPITDPESPMYGRETVYTEYKLNSAYAVGGPKCLVKVVQKLSGLSVNRFMAVDFAGFSKMVDALGGVEVCSTEPLEDYELGTVLSTAGRQMVDGHTALNYVRARQVTTEINGDYGRIKRQQRFLSSLLRSLISKEVFFSLSKLNNVVNMFIDDSYVDNIDTRDLVTLGQSIQGVTAGRITFVTVPTTGYADEWGNETPRTDDMRALFDAIINDDPLPGEKNADNTPVPGTPESTTSNPEAEAPAQDDQSTAELVNAVTTEPQDVTVQVSNSTGQTGLGATAANALQQHGFNVTTPDDYPSELNATTVFFSPGNEQAAATVASSFQNPTIERVTGMGDIVQVVLGSDFNAVAAPTPSGSPVQVNVLHDTGSTPAPLPEDLNVTNAADTTCE